jgi:adenosylmethionine-8-amino-7-oxononanoate aminotransferase
MACKYEEERNMAAVRDYPDGPPEDPRITADEATDLARRHLVQPWPFAGLIGTEARSFIGKGDGVYIWDADGRRLLDGPAGMWCVNVGHRREELAAVMYDQAMALSYNTPWYTMSEPSALLAERIAAHAPGDLGHVFFTTGGSSAVETALRFMQYFNNVRGRPEKKLILSRGGAYHGSTYLSASLNGRPRDHDWMDGAADLVVKLTAPNPFRRPAGVSAEGFADFLVDEFRETVARIGPDSIGAFVAEPVQASGGVIVPPENYLPRIRQICRDNDILYVSDEVVTGFGRLGHVFASGDVFGLDPDMITFAKGVTSGYFPLGGVVISERLLEQLRRSNHANAMFGHGYTYTSHPIGCAVALKNLDLLEGGILDHARKVAPYFQARLKTLAELPLVGEVRGLD